MAIKKLPAAAGDVVAPVLGAAGNRHGVEQGPVAVLPAGEPPTDNTPWS
ncbi:hypothetical protein MUU72_31805 [Streptomyces sp. RS10V-4]|nr:hypothetical protein [Streptomyces rhizoryzae]MCK7627628.1 hypothetical protein [Streptomyces rhizoryzae]